MSKKLKNKKEELFCQEYIKDFNGTRAATATGYSEKTAYSAANRLLKKVEVLARVKELITERAERLCLSADNVVIRLIDIYEKCMQEKPVMAFNFATKELEETGEYAFDSKGALKAAELIGRHLGMFNDKLDLNAPVKINVVRNYVK